MARCYFLWADPAAFTLAGCDGRSIEVRCHLCEDPVIYQEYKVVEPTNLLTLINKVNEHWKERHAEEPQG